jgi:hypothetical protein
MAFNKAVQYGINLLAVRRARWRILGRRGTSDHIDGFLAEINATDSGRWAGGANDMEAKLTAICEAIGHYGPILIWPLLLIYFVSRRYQSHKKR